MLCSLNRRDMKVGSVPLIGFPTGCVYRARAIHALESGRPWPYLRFGGAPGNAR
jgi:hypothetical protein